MTTTTKEIPLPKDLALIVIDYKEKIENYERKYDKKYTEMYRWISGPYIHSDHKNKLSTDEYYKMYSKHQNIFDIMTKDELRDNIQKIRDNCFWAFSD